MTHALRSTLTSALAALGLALALVVGAAAPSEAQTQQEGLVNVSIGDVTVQLPIAIAANLCDINVNVLAEQVRDGGADCEAESGATATAPRNGNDDGNTNQEGLVNVAAGDVTIQAPIGIAANICDANVNALARQVRTGGATCEAVADSGAEG